MLIFAVMERELQVATLAGVAGIAFGLAVTIRRLDQVVIHLREATVAEAADYLESTTARGIIARCARSVAKDFLQERTEASGEPFRG